MQASDTLYTTHITLRDGRVATVRPLRATDVELLATYFQNLSPATRRLYGPHPFDRATAEKLCASLDPSTTLRFVAVLDDGGPNPEIIGYMILTRQIGESDLARYGERIRPEVCGSFAPSIADAYQEQGIGTAMARHVLACARKMGLQQVILMGGVQARNERARHFYQKLGFQPQGEFWTHYGGEDLLNYDMLLEFRGQ